MSHELEGLRARFTEEDRDAPCKDFAGSPTFLETKGVARVERVLDQRTYTVSAGSDNAYNAIQFLNDLWATGHQVIEFTVTEPDYLSPDDN